MSDAAATADRSPPSRSGRLLSLVHALVAYGHQLLATLRPGTSTIRHDPAELAHTFGTSDLVVILTRIALAIRRAGFLERKIIRTADRIDAGPQPEPPPRAPRVARPRGPKRAPERLPTDTLSVLSRLPNVDQIAASVRRQPIGAVLADLCRDLGITRGHPLWDQLHDAINEFGGNFIRLTMERLNRDFPIAHIAERLKQPRRKLLPEPDSTGPPLPAAA
ncbi:MAG TPA: hypothetical protein VL614_25360 [Acetobacteraceae bacterium]|nr:hypothetical protein [Acetobacteraceae bacterium]